MSIFDEGGTVGTLLNVIGLRWDLVRVSGEECLHGRCQYGRCRYRVWWCDNGTKGWWFDKPCWGRVGLGEARVGCFDRADVLSRKSFR